MRKLIVLLLFLVLVIGSFSSVRSSAQSKSSQQVIMTSSSISTTFPTNGVLDDFNRSDSDPIDGSWTGGFSFNLDGTIQVLSNHAAWASGGTSGLGSATWNTTFNTDQEAYLEITTRVGSAFHCLLARVNNAAATNVTGYQICARTDDNEIKVARIDDFATGAIIAVFSQTLSDGDSMGVKLSGNVGIVYYKVGAGAWTALSPAFDASGYKSTGKIGMELFPSGAVADNFGGGNL